MVGPFLPVSSFTSSRDNGDFKLNIARNVGVVPGGSDPIYILVAKKYKSILENLYKWATALRMETDPKTGKPTVRDVPVLVIDDEADHASVDTSASKRDPDSVETDPTTINRLIRQFLSTFQKTAYVGYTATPFANIFIDPDTSHRHGRRRHISAKLHHQSSRTVDLYWSCPRLRADAGLHERYRSRRPTPDRARHQRPPTVVRPTATSRTSRSNPIYPRASAEQSSPSSSLAPLADCGA